MSSRRIVAAALAAALALTAACGGDDDDGNAAAATDQGVDGQDEGDAEAGTGVGMCELVGLEEAEAAIGRPVELAKTTDDPISCVYDTSESGELDLAIVQVNLTPDGLVGTTLEALAAAAAGFAGETGQLESVELGDGAFVVSEGMVPMLFIAHGDDILTISVMGAEDDAAAMVELGGLAVGRL